MSDGQGIVLSKLVQWGKASKHDAYKNHGAVSHVKAWCLQESWCSEWWSKLGAYKNYGEVSDGQSMVHVLTKTMMQ